MNVDPRLAPLGDYGGTTPTHALLADSPAIDAGTNTDAPATDQRGEARLADGDSDGTSTADIGAFELHPSCSLGLTPNTIPSATVGAEYTQTFIAEGGTEAYTFALTDGAPPAGLTLSAGGVLAGAPSAPGEFSFTITAVDLNGCSASRAYTLLVKAPPPICATNVTAGVTITRGGFSRNLATGRFRQIVTLQNTGGAAIQGAISYVVDSLRPSAALYNPAGVTSCAAPLGSAYVNVPVGDDNLLTPGETVRLVLEFTNSAPSQSITYAPRLLAGGRQR